MRLTSKKGITLVEILTVLVILGVTLSVFYTVFVTNWTAFEDRIARSNMWNEANRIIETLTADGRFAQTIDVIDDGSGGTSAVLSDSLNQPIAQYIITADGKFQVDKGGIVKTLSAHIDADRSDFLKEGRGLRVMLAFEDQVLKRTIGFQTSTEVYPRN